MSEVRDLPYAPVEELILELLTPVPVATETIYGNGGLQGIVQHRLTFAGYVSRDQVERYLEQMNFFGYEPCGYGGYLKPREQQAGQHWTYEHSRTCE